MIIMHHGVHYPAVSKSLQQQCLFTQTDLTVGVALQASDCKECLVPVQEVRADRYLLCRKCVPVKELSTRSKSYTGK